MATTAASETDGDAPTKARPKKARNVQPFGGGIALALFAIGVTLLGFWKTFFSQLGNIDFAHMLHGATSSGWLLIVLIQAFLIRSRDYKIHRFIGWLSIAFFTTLIVTSWHMVVLMLSPGAQMPFELAKFFAYTDITAVPLMVFCYVAAIVKRKDRHLHSRLMSITLLAGLLPAGGRMYGLIWTGMDGLIFSMHPTYLTMLAAFGIAAFVDWKNGRLRWPFPLAYAWFLAAYLGLFPAWHSGWLDTVCRWIVASAA
ncbi:MAG: hypothetical protein AB7F98_16455 [Novosphingobium sp.]